MASVAYLINQYPAPSHTFIRREIEALERSGITIHRFSHRVHASTWLDDSDLAERQRTTILTHEPILLIILSAVIALGRPLQLMRCLKNAVLMGWREGCLVKQFGYVLLACILARRMKSLKLSHVHAHMATNAAAVALFCRWISGCTYSMTAHSSYEYDAHSKDAINLRLKVIHSAFVIVVSEHGLREIRDRVPECTRKLYLIRCGLDAVWLKGDPVSIPLEPRLVAVARLDVHKNHRMLIEAAARVCQSKKFCLTIVGDGPLRQILEAEVKRLNLEIHVKFMGWQSQHQIRSHLRNARALVLSSKTEGLPVAIMEAFAAGRPVIATDVGGVRELVVNDCTGWLVPSESIVELAAAMGEAITATANHLQKMAACGRALVLKSHNIEDTNAALVGLFKQVVENDGGGRLRLRKFCV